MKRLTDKQLAEKLLKVRKEGYPHWKKNLLGRSKIHIFRWVLIAFLLLSLINIKEDIELIRFISILFGFIVGAIVKETLFVKKIGENWDFTQQITDWDKVEEIAGSGVDQDGVVNSVTAPPPLRD